METSDLDSLLDKYKIRADLTHRVGLEDCSGVRAFKVEGNEIGSDLLELYILDIPEGRQIACYPHLVGDKFDRLNRACASKASRAIKEITKFNRKGKFALHLHILRAAPGYRLWEAFGGLGIEVPQLWIRPRYKRISYRDHLIEDKHLEIVYRDFESLPKNEDLMLIVPDTIASGRSMVLSIEELLRASLEVRSRVRELMLYGFVSLEGVEFLQERAKKWGIKLTAFALESITPLAFNRYDMPLYGADESYWEKTGKVKLLGGITDRSVLKAFLPKYVPGCDQPGDFSARQKRLFNGREYELGGIAQHLKNSIKLIEDLERIPNCLESWQTEIAERELIRLREVLSLYQKNLEEKEKN